MHAEQATLPGSDTTGTHPPPLPRQVDWQTAIGSAALVAVVAAILSIVALRLPVLSFVSTLWTLTASMTTLTLYQRRRPSAWMDASVGARIGLTAGLALIVMIGSSMAIAGLVARFGLHAMANFDAGFAELLLQVKQTAAAAATPPPPEVLKLYDQPEFQAGLILSSIAISAVFLLIFTTLGGALGGLLRTRRIPRT